MSNPFVPASWGETYKLAGVPWMPEGVPKELYDPRCDVLAVFAERSHRMYGTLEIIAPIGPAGMRGSPYKPLLPSPDFINAQADPRAVAIAALERAGFAAEGIRNWWRIKLSDSTLLAVSDTGQAMLEWAQLTDPALARYAVDCFTTLHQWAAGIDWDAEEAQHGE